MHLYLGFLILLFVTASCNENTAEEIHETKIYVDSTANLNYNIFNDAFDRQSQFYGKKLFSDSVRMNNINPKILLNKIKKQFPFDHEVFLEILSVQSIYLYGSNNLFQDVKIKTTVGYCPYPNAYRDFIFSSDGKLLFTFRSSSSELRPFMQDSTLSIVSIEHNCSGEGVHRVFVCHGDRFIDVLNSLSDKKLITYDINPDGGLIDQEAFSFDLTDLNGDEYPDLKLKGNRIYYSSDGKQSNSVSQVYYFKYYPTKKMFLESN